ncbi:MAG TPA: ATP-dependent DNA helicase RecG [Thermoanaerobaculia bacterium]|nr:ATP-dependent DNA helicase RecG [Thermoanaerobaculia bacterium]
MRSARRVDSTVAPDTPVQYLRGVGDERARRFAAVGVETARDLLDWLPFRWEDRRYPTRIAEIRRPDAAIAVRGRVIAAGAKTTRVRRMQIFEAVIDDGSGTLLLVFFHQPWLGERIARGDVLSVWGTPHVNARGRLQMQNPEWEKLEGEQGDEEGAIVPIYPQITGIPPKVVRATVRQALEAILDLDDPMPEPLRRRLGVIGLSEAIAGLHAPAALGPELEQGRSPAHRRLILDEFFAFQLALRIRRCGEERRRKKRKIVVDERIRAKVREVLPFRLTAAQKRVLHEIAADLQSERPMYRLLQGDVGSGKTIVALIAAMLAIENGHQAALLAPTAILAEQHYQRVRQYVDHRVRLARLAGSTPPSERKSLLAALAAGEIDLLVGTHALLEKPVAFRSLGLAIVDEQHRFGVAQRQKLFEKGELPDILVMTATPIPRSLAISMFGDLELSVIDELPPGRTPVRTVVRGTARLPRVWEFVESELAAGAQAYVVFPIIEESEKVDLKALTAGVDAIRKAFPTRRIGMLHGRLPAEQKRVTMDAFVRGELDLLVSTTVIEVGIDVPNASVMVILDADRFGFSQLHQLRGRVGRGSRRSWSILIRDEGTSEEAKRRLQSFAATRDGFEVAERDLEMRGPGDFFGTRQSGAVRFRVGSLIRDFALMELAREVAIEAVEARAWGDPEALLRLLSGAEEATPARD